MGKNLDSGEIIIFFGPNIIGKIRKYPPFFKTYESIPTRE